MYSGESGAYGDVISDVIEAPARRSREKDTEERVAGGKEEGGGGGERVRE